MIPVQAGVQMPSDDKNNLRVSAEYVKNDMRCCVSCNVDRASWIMSVVLFLVLWGYFVPASGAASQACTSGAAVARRGEEGNTKVILTK